VRDFGPTNIAPWAAAPTGLNPGDTYFNTTSRLLYVYDGTTWNALGIPPPATTAQALCYNTGTNLPYWGQPSGITSGWFINPQGFTLTFNSTNSFQVSGNASPYMSAGTPIRWQQSGAYLYGYVVTCTNAVNSLLTIYSSSNVANAAVTEWGVSSGYPEDMPGYFTFTPTYATGYSVAPTGIGDTVSVTGGMCCYSLRQLTNGTSNSTDLTFNSPFRAVNTPNGLWNGYCTVVDNGTTATTPGTARIQANSTVIGVYKDADMASNKWTASGGKRVAGGQLWYPIR